MILNYSDSKMNTKTFVFTRCDKCGKDQKRKLKRYEELKLNPTWNMDYCEPCWASIRQKTPEAKAKMSESINQMIDKDPDWKIRNSESKKGKINLGESNGMKSEEARKKASISRSKLMSSGYSKTVSEYTKKAWAEGKFDGVKVGRSQWYHYKHSNGKIYKVQGRYEYNFIEWLDSNNIEFECHPKKLTYFDSKGNIHSYLPDFFVKDWNCYVEIKNKFHMSQQIEKFNSIQKSNPSIKIKIMIEKDLEDLGIDWTKQVGRAVSTE
jgi:hypothetical protein